jgi:hypothetical protein
MRIANTEPSPDTAAEPVTDSKKITWSAGLIDCPEEIIAELDRAEPGRREQCWRAASTKYGGWPSASQVRQVVNRDERGREPLTSRTIAQDKQTARRVAKRRLQAWLTTEPKPKLPTDIRAYIRTVIE